MGSRILDILEAIKLMDINHRFICKKDLLLIGDEVLKDDNKWYPIDNKLINTCNNRDHYYRRQLLEKTKQLRAETIKEYNDINDFECDYCCSNEKCEYAFDAYNTNGDCLGIK